MKFRAVQHTDAGRYGCCFKMENGKEQCRNVTLMVYSTIANADFLQDVAAAHVHGVIEQREDLPAEGDNYSYDIDPVRQLNDADNMLRGWKLMFLYFVHRLEVHKSLALHSKCAQSNQSAALPEVFNGCRQSFQANTRIVP
jgi:hypothetical protein